MGKLESPMVAGEPRTVGEKRGVEAAIGEVDGVELDGVLRLIAREIAEILGAGRCSIHLLDNSTSLFRGQVAYSSGTLDGSVKELVSGLPGDRFTHEIIATRKPVMLRNARSDPRAIRVAMRRWNTRSVLGIPVVLREKVIGLICVDTEGEPFEVSAGALEMALRFAAVAANIIEQTSRNVELRSELATVARQNDMLRRAMAMENRLTKLILKGASLQEVCDAVSGMTSHTSFVYDHAFTALADGRPEGTERELPRIFDGEFRTHPLVVDALAAIAENSTAVIGPFPSIGIHQRALVAPINVGDSRWGYFVIVERRGPLGPLDTVIARRTAANIALDLGAEHRTAGAHQHAVASFTAALLHGNYERGWLARRSDYLGVRLSARRVVCLLRSRGLESAPPSPRTLIEAIANDAAPADTILSATVDSTLALLLDVPDTGEDGPSAVERMEEVIGRIGQRDDLLVAISSAREDSGQIADAYLEAKQVMRCIEGHLTRPGDHVVSADDLGAGRLFLAMANPGEARSFAESVVGSLSAGDDERSGELLETLDVFLSAACSARRSAEALEVHENTIRYRVARIEELTGLAIATDADAQLTAQLALSVFRIGGQLPRPAERRGSRPR